jgi:choline kinase
MIRPIHDAVVLMAGRGSRLRSGAPVLKPLVSVGGRPIISHAMETFLRHGVRTLHCVVGANGDALAAGLRSLLPRGLRLNIIANPHWQKQNGVSVLQAEGRLTAPFLLTMGDHLFAPELITTLLAEADEERLNLAVDRKLESIFDLDDAMKVETDGDDVVAISKTLTVYDAIDTGLFLCPTALFDYLRRAQRDEDCSLADGVRLMAADRRVRAIDIGEGWWQDVDTPEMLERAEQESARLFGQNRRGRAEKSVAGHR